ncbi:unnamed protein product, partial [Didymodactylos carnosus]
EQNERYGEPILTAYKNKSLTSLEIIEKLLQNLNLVKKVDILNMNSRCHLALSFEHIIVYDYDQFYLLNKRLDHLSHSSSWKDIEDIQWCSYLNEFIILTRTRLSKFNPTTYEIDKIILKHDRGGHKTPYSSITTNDDHGSLFINCGHGQYIEHYSLKTGELLKRWSQNPMLITAKYFQITKIQYLAKQNRLIMNTNIDNGDYTAIELVDVHTMKVLDRLEP